MLLLKKALNKKQGENMKRLMTLLIIGGMLTLFTGCLYMDTTMPGRTNSTTVFQLNSGDFDVLDRVSVEGETTLWFGAVLTGGKGYQDLLAQAMELGGDEIMNYSFDTEQLAVLGFIYSRVRWKATGVAVKFKDQLSDGK